MPKLAKVFLHQFVVYTTIATPVAAEAEKEVSVNPQ
jgi:hypothetical protein